MICLTHSCTSYIKYTAPLSMTLRIEVLKVSEYVPKIRRRNLPSLLCERHSNSFKHKFVMKAMYMYSKLYLYTGIFYQQNVPRNVYLYHSICNFGVKLLSVKQ